MHIKYNAIITRAVLFILDYFLLGHLDHIQCLTCPTKNVVTFNRINSYRVSKSYIHILSIKSQRWPCLSPPPPNLLRTSLYQKFVLVCTLSQLFHRNFLLFARPSDWTHRAVRNYTSSCFSPLHPIFPPFLVLFIF